MQASASVQTGSENPAGTQQVERSPTHPTQGHVVHARAGAYSSHAPSMQSSRAPHARPHSPQFATSTRGFTHAPLQSLDGCAHWLGATHTPATQVVPLAQLRPTAPQFCGLDCRSTQRPMASVSPGRQAQRPALQS
jgi:hypothetical protein